MIRVDRSTEAAPDILSSEEARSGYARARRFYERPLEGRRQERHDWDPLWLQDDMTDALRRLFVSKCAYCEQTIATPEMHVIDHFRPRANAGGGDEPAPDHYWWLAYEWGNLYLSCEACSYHKGEKFPVGLPRTAEQFEGRAPLGTPFSELHREANLLLDPCSDEPLEHLEFLRTGMVRAKSERGEATIAILGLNRSELLELRRDVGGHTIELLDQIAGMLLEDRPLDVGRGLGQLLAPERPFRGQTLYQLQPWLTRNRPRLQSLLPENVLSRLDLRAPPSSKSAPSKMSEPLAGLVEEFAPFVAEALRTISWGGGDASGSAMEGVGAEPAEPPQRQKLMMRRRAPSEQAAAAPDQPEDAPGRPATTPPSRAKARKRKTTRSALRTALIERVTIHNFRAISRLSIDFPQAASAREGGTPRPPGKLTSRQESVTAPWLMLLGENGTGKSSVLEAITLTLAGERARKSLDVRPDDVLRAGTAEGSVRVYLSGDPKPVTLSFEAGGTRFVSTVREPGIQVFAYGATRLLPNRKRRPPRDPGQIRIKNLFDPFSPLVDADRWLTALWDKKKGGKDQESFDNQALAFKDLLSISQKAQITGGEDGHALTIRLGGADLSFDKLSDGYQSVVALAADIMKGLHAGPGRGPVETLEGLVLLDEIGAHLHPRWNMEVVERLRRAFPRVQFVATTHEPLCLRGLRDGEVTILRRGPRGGISKVPDAPSVRGLRVDQLLTSPYFGLNSTVDPELERWVDEYYKLLRVRRRTTKQRERMTELKAAIDGRQQLGRTERERMLLEVIDEFLAKSTTQPAGPGRTRLDTRTRRELERIWQMGNAAT